MFSKGLHTSYASNSFESYILILFLFFFFSTSFGQELDCLDCHDQLNEKSVHFQLDCSDCHEAVENEEHAENGVEKVSCASCHEEYSELLKTDIHYRLSSKVKNPPSCKKCHGKHEIYPTNYYPNKEKKYCSKCHGNNVILANPFHSRRNPDSICFECHDDTQQELQENIAQSVHKQLACSDCHNYVSNNLELHSDGDNKTQIADCYICHVSISVEHKNSVHGIALLQGVDDAAKCWDCHGGHSIKKVSDSTSPVQSKNLAKTCAKCHDDQEIVEKYNLTHQHPGEKYQSSIHGKNVEKGGNAANCSSCHGVHNIKNKLQKNSLISAQNIPETCGECHQKEKEEYLQSIHWIRAKKGVRDSPVCNDCHDEHGLQKVAQEKSNRANTKLILEETCFQCHQNPKIIQRYSNGKGQPSLYRDSYHGLASERGSDNAALCVDCHNVHKILPASAPESSINYNNVTNTCKKCHEDATLVFSQSYSHKSLSVESERIESIISNVYFWLIVVVIGGMLLHNIIIYLYEVNESRKKNKDKIKLPRFTKSEIYQHIILVVSFTLLAITGFALKYPKSFWSEGLLSLGMTELIRQCIHRISAVVMILVSLYHLIYLIFTDRGRDLIGALFPRHKDLKAFYANMKFHLHLSNKKPEFDQYDYAEKAEYWALIWGTFIMGVTGIILWFPTLVGSWAPTWLIKVSETIHFMEAILASLAILVWHWFFVIYRPSVYPMSFVWLDGTISLKDYRHHHESHFRKILLEWYKLKSENHKKNKTSNYFKLFKKTLEDNNLSMDEVFENEIINDPTLKDWLENELHQSSPK